MQKETAMQVTDEMVSRFLTWKLPATFTPDCGIDFRPFHPNGVTRFEPVGTNLLNATEARQMLEHVLGGREHLASADCWCSQIGRAHV